MSRQQKTFEMRVEQWASKNLFKFIKVDENTVYLERLSDDRPMPVNARLLDQIMTDEGF